MKMKRILSNAFIASVLAAVAGCATVENSPAPQPPAQVHPQPQSMPLPPPPAPIVRNPTVNVSATAFDQDSANLTGSMLAAAKSDLASRGFDVVDGDDADYRLALGVRRRESTRLQDWRSYEGRIEAKIENGKTGELAATNKFAAVGERSSNELAAESSVREFLALQLSAWLAGAIPADKIEIPAEPR